MKNRKKLFISAALLAVLLAVVLAAPRLIDWNSYKPLISQQVFNATGRALEIRGDIELDIFPAPSLVVRDIRLANAEGASSPHMVTLERAEVRAAWGPLLAGNVQVEMVRLIRPLIELETMADGRANWVFAKAETTFAPATDAQVGSGGGGGSGGFDLQLDDLMIEGAVLNYRDAAAGSLETIADIQAQVAVASIKGPIEGSGSLVARGMPLKFEATMGKIIQGRTMPLDLAIGLGAGRAELKVSGTVTGLDAAPKFKGRTEVQGGDLAALIRGLAPGDPLPPLLSRPFGVKGLLAGSAEQLSLTETELSLGDIKLDGQVEVALGEVPNLQIDLKAGRIDLDGLLAAGQTAAPRQPLKPAATSPAPAPGKKTVAADEFFSLPGGIAASLRLGIDVVTYREGAIRQVVVNADLAGGELTLSQLSAQLPGSTEVAIFGFLSAKNGKPLFEGEAEATASDFRGLLDWLGVSPGDMPKERLRRLTYKSAIEASPVEARVLGIKAELDSSKLTGGLTARLSGRPAFGADIVVDRVNLDAYMPEEKPANTGSSSNPAPAKGEAKPAAADPLAGLSALSGFDANIKARVQSAIYRGANIKEVMADLTLHNGKLEIRDLSVMDAAGAALKIKGGLEKFDTLPEMKGLQVDFKAADPARIMRLAGMEPPAGIKDLGAVAFQAKGNGPLLKPSLDAILNAAGGEVRVNGAGGLFPALSFDAALSLRHPDLARLARTAGADYRPTGQLGGIEIAMRAKGGPDRIDVSGIQGNLGPTAIAGTVGVVLTGAVPKLTAALDMGELPIDRFLPAQRTASISPSDLFGVPGLIPASLAAGGTDPRWSSEPLDLAALKSLDAEIAIKSRAISHQKYRLDDADIGVNLAGGLLRIEKITGRLFDGALQGAATLDASGPLPKVQARLKAEGVNAARLVAAAAPDAGITAGSVFVETDIASQGGSIAGLVSALAGRGAFDLKGIDAKRGGKGSSLSGLLDLLVGLNSLGGSLGGQPGSGLADVSGSFAITDGLAKSQDIKLATAAGAGAAVAAIDLPRWLIDASGEMDLSQGVLTALLIQKSGGQARLPFSIKGPLDAPSVKLDTASLPGGGLSIPGLKTDRGAGKVIDRLLPGVLGGGQQPAPAPAETIEPAPGELAPPPPKEPEAAPQKVRPEDLLRGILRGR